MLGKATDFRPLLSANVKMFIVALSNSAIQSAEFAAFHVGELTWIKYEAARSPASLIATENSKVFRQVFFWFWSSKTIHRLLHCSNLHQQLPGTQCHEVFYHQLLQERFLKNSSKETSFRENNRWTKINEPTSPPIYKELLVGWTNASAFMLTILPWTTLNYWMKKEKFLSFERWSKKRKKLFTFCPRMRTRSESNVTEEPFNATA